MQSDRISDDIRTYIRGRLDTEPKLKRWQNLKTSSGSGGMSSICEEIESSLTKQADGMFRLVVCQLDELTACYNPQQLRKRLRSLPKNLDDMYTAMLARIRDDNVDFAFRILQWLTYSVRPLTVDEVAEMLCLDMAGDGPDTASSGSDDDSDYGDKGYGRPRLDPDRRFLEPREILDICPGLVITTEASSESSAEQGSQQHVQLAHYSVKEFLVSKSIQKLAPRYAIGEADAHASMATACIGYLLSLEDFHELAAKAPGAIFEEYPLAAYAAQHWTSHAKRAKDNKAVVSLGMELFQSFQTWNNDIRQEEWVGGLPYYSNWIRVYNPDKPWQLPSATSLFLGHWDKMTQTDLPPPLYLTSLCGLLGMTRALVESGADINIEGGICGSPLQAASRGGHKDVVKYLVESGGADVNTVAGKLYGTPLQAASFWGHYDVVKYLLDEAGAEVNHSIPVGKYGSALLAAAQEGHVAVVKILLKAGANVLARGRFYGDALQAAAFYGHESVVQELIAAGADPNRQSGGIYGDALQAAARNGHMHIVSRLIEAGARVDGGPGGGCGMYHTAMQSAARGAHSNVIKALLDFGADVNAQGGKYGNALQSACLVSDDNSAIETIRVLLDAGGDVNARGGVYGTALQAACAHGFAGVAQTLLEAGADVNIRNSGIHGAAVIAAAANGHYRLLHTLLSQDQGGGRADVRGWRITMSGRTSLSPSSTATSSVSEQQLIVQLLRDAGAEVITTASSSGTSSVAPSPTTASYGKQVDGNPGIIVEYFDDHSRTCTTNKLDHLPPTCSSSSSTSDGDPSSSFIRQAASSVKFCDECGMPIPDGAKYYHCSICLNDDWDSCEACVRAGFPCRDPRHRMTRRQIRNGIIVEIDN